MFTNEWRDFWGLHSEPFSCEDADKDFVLAELDVDTVHSGFDRLYGDPEMPAPSIVFGEKGSGKSGLRLMMKRRLDAHNASRPESKIFVVEYIEFNGYLEHFRGLDSRPAEKVLGGWTLSDHIDSLLSLGTTHLVDSCLDDSEKPEKLSRKQKLNLQLLAALYYNSKHRTATNAQRSLSVALRIFSGRKFAAGVLLGLLTIVSLFLMSVPHTLESDMGDARYWYFGGAALLAVTWGQHRLSRFLSNRRARKAAASIRVLPRDTAPIAAVLNAIPGRERSEFSLPESNREEGRFELLQRLFDLTSAFGYRGWYVLMDRVDEPSLLSGDAGLMSKFIETLLDIKLLQYPGLALKMFLPIELESLYRTATAADLKSMRLDKSNLIPELKWGGQELYEISNKRLQACVKSVARLKKLADMFEEDFDLDYLRSTLQALGTPRYCFGFLSAVITEHVKELPCDLEPDDPQWRIPRSRFDVQRAAWVDRTGIMRRTMN